MSAAQPLTTTSTLSSRAGGRLNGGVGAALGGVLVWSTNAVGAEVAFSRHGLGAVLVAMAGGATVALLAVRGVFAQARRKRAPVLTWRERAFGLSVGIVGLGGTLVSQYVGFVIGPLLEANVISYGWPMFAALVLAVLAPSRGTWFGVGFAVLGFAGVLVMFSGSAGHGGHGPWGYIAALVSALCMAFYTLAIARTRLPLVDVLLAGAGSALVVAIGACMITGADVTPSPELAAAAYCGIGPVACGYLLWSRAMTISGGKLAPLGYAIPLLSTGLLLLTGLPLTLSTAIGAIMIVVCTVGVLSTRLA